MKFATQISPLLNQYFLCFLFPHIPPSENINMQCQHKSKRLAQITGKKNEFFDDEIAKLKDNIDQSQIRDPQTN